MLVICEGETAAEVMERIQRKLKVPDEEFSKVNVLYYLLSAMFFTICRVNFALCLALLTTLEFLSGVYSDSILF